MPCQDALVRWGKRRVRHSFTDGHAVRVHCASLARLIPIKAVGMGGRGQSPQTLPEGRAMFRISSYIREVATPTPPGPRRQPPGPVVIWNLIRRCNLTCKHCYSISADTDFAGELSTDEVYRTMDDLKSCGRQELTMFQYFHHRRRSSLPNSARSPPLPGRSPRPCAGHAGPGASRCRCRRRGV